MPDCKTCKESKVADVPYIVHETEMARAERGQKRWFIIALVLTIFLFVSNGWWVWRESQFTTTTKTITSEVEQETGEGGNNSFYGGDYYGSAEGSADGEDYDANP